MTSHMKYVIGVVALVIGFILGYVLHGTTARSGSTIAAGNFPQILINPALWTNGLGAGDAAQWQVDNKGNVTQTGTFALGTNGSSIAFEKFGTCNILASATTIAGTSTQTVDCGSGTNGATAITGIKAGDNVTLTFSTTTPTTLEGGLRILGVSASSTPGFITALIYNATGGTFTWTSAASSSLMYTDRR